MRAGLEEKCRLAAELPAGSLGPLLAHPAIAAVQKAMKEIGLSLLSNSEHSVTRASTAKLTHSRQRDVVTYKPEQIVEFHRTALGSVRGGVQEKRFQKRRFPLFRR
jgi:hypothetical protein